MSIPHLSLGLSLGPRAGAAVLMHGQGLIASSVEERVGYRRPALPLRAIQHCLRHAGLKDLSSVQVISLQSRHARDWADFLANQFAEDKSWIEGLLSFPSNLRHELRFRAELRRELEQLGGSQELPEVVLVADEQAIAQGLNTQRVHRRTGYLLMDVPFARLATGLWQSVEGRLEPIWVQEFPQSLELLVANFAGFCGFRGRMGQRQFLQLAEYGEPRFKDLIKNELMQIKDGARFDLQSERLALEPLRETEWSGLDPLIEEGPRQPDQPISSREIDLSHALMNSMHEWQDEMARVALEEFKLQELVIRGQGPLFDRLKLRWRRQTLNCRTVGLQDEPLLMAAGAACEALESRGQDLRFSAPLNLRPAAAFQEYLRSSVKQSADPRSELL